MPTAVILVIGNEILSGKVVDANSPYLCGELRSLGVDVERIVVVPDSIEVIAGEVKSMSQSYDWVFTSGGVGPTHDDVTMDGIAAGFGVPMVINDSIVARLERAQGKPLNESMIKMAKLPEGAMLLDAGDLWFPVVHIENVYILPGIPELLKRKFDSIRERFRGEPFVLRRVYVKQHESDIAEGLRALLGEFPDLMLGSYPKIGEKAFHVMLTLECRDEAYVQRALDALLARLPGDAIHKVE